MCNVVIYFSYGPNSAEVQMAIRHIDDVLGTLMREFDERDLTDKVNIILTSDHGMTDVSNERTIYFGDYVNFGADIFWSYLSTIGLIIPNEGKVDEVRLSCA